MEWMPTLKLVWCGGWLPLILSSIIQWGLLFAMPKEVFSRLFDRKGWSKKQRVYFRLGKAVGLVCLLLVALTPLKKQSPFFFVGIILYILGLMGLIIATLTYRDTPLDQPVMKGLYRISRHPQIVATTTIFLGICLAIGSWIALLLLTIAKILEHNGILAEEEVCLKEYGEVYKEYLEKVPRYFLFF